MRTDATFIIIPYSRLSATTVLPLQQPGGINILIDSADFDVTTILKFTAANNYKLLYSLSGALINNSRFIELLPRIYLLHTLCDPFIKNQGIIPVFSAEAVASTQFNSLKDYFEQQGEKNIDFALFENNTGMQVKNNLLFLPAAQLQSFDNTGFNNLVNQEIHLVFIETGAAVNENKWLEFLFHTIAFTRANGWEKYKLTLWQERAKLYLSFIALGKKVGEAEYYDLRQWYHNEYEVLPLWFKRLGHILKVLTGKRSLKSLLPRRIKQPN